MFKKVNKNTIFGKSTKHGEHKVFQTIKDYVFPEERNKIEEQYNVSLHLNLILHYEQVKMAAENAESFGIQQSSGKYLTENTASNKAILNRTEHFMKVPEGHNKRIGKDIGRSLHNAIYEGKNLVSSQQ